MNAQQFQKFILDWYRRNNRDYLPWRVTSARKVSPYEIFVSEIMLQQTQVARVLEKYSQFLKAFPTIHHLARAPLGNVLRVWQGMGYNRRARYLKEAAKKIVERYHGVIPSDSALLRALPGVGPYTAGAIACFAYNKPVVFLDTNIRKVLINKFRHGENCVAVYDDKELLQIAEKILYQKNPRRWHYALMDYGAVTLAKKKGLLKRVKSYHKQPRFAGSTRYWRSQIMKYLLQYDHASKDELQAFVPSGEIKPLLSSLAKDGLVETSDDLYRISR
ncbi:MAG: A/G-specific adenine glycosylase [Candidatus Colwellbacteria bacterium]|nr:A/G-specific adenine glycosylase [Candidatus Colwellbacteria bacterium]